MLDLQEEDAIDDIANNIDDAVATLKPLLEKAEPFALSASEIKSTRDLGNHIKENLTLSVDELRRIARQAGTFDERPSDDANRRSARLTIMEAIESFNEEFLPKYESLVASAVSTASTAKAPAQAPIEPGKTTPTPPSPTAPTTPAPPSPATAPPAASKGAAPPSATGILSEGQALVNQALAVKTTVQEDYSAAARFWKSAKPYVTLLIKAAKWVLLVLV